MNAEQIANLNKQLEARKIALILKEWGWVACERYDSNHGKARPGWSFPLWDESGKVLPEKKWKAGDGLKAKNAMMPKRPEFPYYMPPGTLDAIKASSEIWIAEGEPDVATLHTLGIRNAICWLFGADSIPERLPDDLKRWGVFKVYHCPDQDEAGYLSAVDLDKMLADKGFRLKIVKVDGELNSHKDLNDMLMSKGAFDPRALPAWTLPELKALTDTKPLPKRREVTSGQIPPRDFALNPRVADALLHEAQRQAGGRPDKRIDGRRAIPILSIYSREHDSPGEHAYYFPDNHSGWDYGDKKAGDQWYAAEVLVERWNINVEALGGWTEKAPVHRPTSEVVSEPPTQERPSDMFISQAQVARDWIEYLRDLSRKPDAAVMWNPFPHLHEFGGLAKFMVEGMVMLILGNTGGKKSILLENMLDQMNIGGQWGFLIGGEWTPHLSGAKAIQRHGGAAIEELFEDSVARSMKMRGLPVTDVKVLTDAKRLQSQQVASALTKMPGDTIHFNSKYSQLGFSTILENVAREIVIQREVMKKTVTYVALDYAQYYTDENTYKGQNIPEHILTAFKLFCVNMRVCGFVTSQITKVAQKEAAQGETISIADGLGLRSDKANLVISIENVMAGTNVLPYKKISILKNSLGRTDHFYLHDAPGGNHLQFRLEGDGIEPNYIVEGQVYQAQQEAKQAARPEKIV